MVGLHVRSRVCIHIILIFNFKLPLYQLSFWVQLFLFLQFHLYLILCFSLCIVNLDCGCYWTQLHPSLSWTLMDTPNSCQDMLLTCPEVIQIQRPLQNWRNILSIFAQSLISMYSRTNFIVLFTTEFFVGTYLDLLWSLFLSSLGWEFWFMQTRYATK